MNFAYRAYLANGREESGAIEADSRSDATRKLAAQGRSAFELKSVALLHTSNAQVRTPVFEFGALSLTRLFLDLAVMTEAGLTLSQALRALLAGETSRPQRNAIEKVAGAMNQGRTAAEAFATIDGMPADAVALIASGERSHQMPEVLRALSNQMTERDRQTKELREALAYPAFLFLMMILALGTIIFVLVPSLLPIFENSRQPPPLVMRALAAFGELVAQPECQAIALLFVCCLAMLVLPSVRKRATPFGQRLMLALPFLGKAIHKAWCARYLNSLSMLLAGGTPMTEALTLSADCNPILHLRSTLKSVRDQVSAGDRLPTALGQTRQFDPKVISLISVGDEVNRLPTVLAKAAAILEEESKATMSRLLAALTPAMTIVLGVAIGTLVTSVMTALLSINDIALQP